MWSPAQCWIADEAITVCPMTTDVCLITLGMLLILRSANVLRISVTGGNCFVGTIKLKRLENYYITLGPPEISRIYYRVRTNCTFTQPQSSLFAQSLKKPLNAVQSMQEPLEISEKQEHGIDLGWKRAVVDMSCKGL